MEDIAASFRPGVPGLVPDAWIVSPAQTVSAPPVVVVHGITRNVDEMVAHLKSRAWSTGRTLVLPHFCSAEWPRYQRAACKQRADLALLRLMTTLCAEEIVLPGRFDLSGFSGGAQFAHRFTWLYPQAVARLCVTAPGWWTFPDARTAWPYGMAAPRGRDAVQGFRLDANLRAFLDRRIIVCVGSEDVDRDPNLRQGADIDAQQGQTRFIRAHRWVDMAEARAREAGLEPMISLRVLQGCGHSFADCVTRAGLDRDFVPPAAPSAANRKVGAFHAVCHTELTPERNAA